MTKEKTKKVPVDNIESLDGSLADLIVFNDDYNLFDYVVDCFINICGLSFEQALAITSYIHHNGSGIVKTDEYPKIKQMKDQLIDCGLNAIVSRKSVN